VTVRITAPDRLRDAGLLLLRVGIGLSYIGYGYPKLLGGPPMWEQLGQAMNYVGLAFAHTVWGFLAAVSEFCGGVALVLGAFFRVAAFFLVSTMAVATIQHFGRGDGYRGGAYHSIELGVVCLSLFLIGPGRYSVDEALARRQSRPR
jgi:putative oxidoreductase